MNSIICSNQVFGSIIIGVIVLGFSLFVVVSMLDLKHKKKVAKLWRPKKG